MMTNYKTKSRSQQRREAVQRGKKLPTFTGSKVKPAANSRDPHVHITPEAHALVASKAAKDDARIKDVASAAIIKALGRK
jgi:hypothetical protein